MPKDQLCEAMTLVPSDLQLGLSLCRLCEVREQLIGEGRPLYSQEC